MVDTFAGPMPEELPDIISVPREVLQIAFDTAVHSLDFGSGFLDDDEVSALRAIAVVLGVDPMVATPPEFKCKYNGQHKAWTAAATEANRRTCVWCKKVLDA